jgi:hypothetical protein
MKRTIKIDATVKCLCGGEVSVGLQGALAHTFPTCKDYDTVKTVADAADYLARVRRKLDAS